MIAASQLDSARRPFIEHVKELQIRLSIIAVSVLVFGVLAFGYHQQLLSAIQAPLNQTLYFTSPTGGLSFIFELCVTVGVIISLPLIIYQIYKFLQPLMGRQSRLTVFGYIFWSIVLAAVGGLFAYFITLPMALQFLVQFGGEGIQSMIKADEYFSFALAYIAGFALMFQIPLITMIINRVKPLKPMAMMKAQRWVILISFILAALITPTPDPVNQTMMAAPAIVLYQASILMTIAVNKRRPISQAASESISTHSSVAALPVRSVRAQRRSKRSTPKPRKLQMDGIRVAPKR